MSPTNHALWLPAKQSPTMTVGEASYPSPGPNELVIRTKAVAMNPADNVIQKAGLLLTKYPAILGCDGAGIVEEVGSDLKSTFKSGDRVIGQTGPLEDYKYSSFQEYVVLKTPMLAKIPDDADFADAVVLPLGLTTAASCLYGSEMLDLHYPPSKDGNGKILLIWGASSSVGCCGLQLAAAAGYEVFAIASLRNHNMLRSLGATQCFDYRNIDLIESVVKSLDDKEVVGALDAISSDDTLHALCEILHQSGGRKFISSIMPGADTKAKLDVTIMPNLNQDMSRSDFGPRIWQGVLPSALESGKIQYKPDAEIVGHGLDAVQKALDMLAQGVSAKKLVVTL